MPDGARMEWRVVDVCRPLLRPSRSEDRGDISRWSLAGPGGRVRQTGQNFGQRSLSERRVILGRYSKKICKYRKAIYVGPRYMYT